MTDAERSERGWRIGELARQTGLTTKTIRYYEEAGLLPPPDRTAGGYRLYRQEDADRLAFILAAKDFGFALGEIREILAVRERGEVPCPYVLGVVRAKLADMRDRIRRLELLSGDLEAIVGGSEALPADARTGEGRFCHAIETRRPRRSRDAPDATLDRPAHERE